MRRYCVVGDSGHLCGSQMSQFRFDKREHHLEIYIVSGVTPCDVLTVDNMRFQNGIGQIPSRSLATRQTVAP